MIVIPILSVLAISLLILNRQFQQQAIEKAVSEIGVLNAGKKRDEILEMVGPYFSRLEKHLGQMKKYQATIDYLTQENEGLKEKANSETFHLIDR